MQQNIAGTQNILDKIIAFTNDSNIFLALFNNVIYPQYIKPTLKGDVALTVQDIVTFMNQNKTLFDMIVKGVNEVSTHFKNELQAINKQTAVAGITGPMASQAQRLQNYSEGIINSIPERPMTSLELVRKTQEIFNNAQRDQVAIESLIEDMLKYIRSSLNAGIPSVTLPTVQPNVVEVAGLRNLKKIKLGNLLYIARGLSGLISGGSPDSPAGFLEVTQQLQNEINRL